MKRKYIYLQEETVITIYLEINYIVFLLIDKKTLVFDLDETLIHCNENASIPSDVMLPIKFPSGETIQVNIKLK